MPPTRFAAPTLHAVILAVVSLIVPCGCDPAPPRPAASGPSTQATAQDATPRGATLPSTDAPKVDVGPPVVEAIHDYSGGAQQGDTMPLVVAVHGLGDNPASFRHLFSAFPGKAHFVFPAGGLPWGNGHAWWPITGPLDENRVAPGLDAAAARLAGGIRGWRDAHTAGKTILTGFSQGGMLSFTIAAKYPRDVGEAVPISGFVPAALVPPVWPAGDPRPRIVALHGDADERVPFAFAQRSVASLKALGVEVDLKSYAGVGHTISPDMRRDLFTAIGDAVERARQAERP